MGVQSVHVSPSASMQKDRSVLMKAGQDSFCMEGLAVGRETATSWAAAREFLRMRNVFEDTV